MDEGTEPTAEGAFDDDVIYETILEDLISMLTEIKPKYGRIFRLLYDGATQQEMADELGIKQRTVSDDIKKIRSLVQPLAKDIPCFLIDSHNRIRLLKARTILQKSQQFGKYVSLLPLTTEVTGVTLTGMKYPLQDAAFTSDNTLGVSNEIVEDEAVIDLKNGILIMIESRD